MLRNLLLTACISYTLAVICYDCYDTGPDHTACTKERNYQLFFLANCIFCKYYLRVYFAQSNLNHLFSYLNHYMILLVDAGDNATSTAFCLLAMRGDESITQKTGCWLEPDGRGRHCLCHEDFCNKLIPRDKQSPSDPMVPLLPNAEFLKQNPLLDYQDHLEESVEHDGAAPAPENILFPSAASKDPRTAGGPEDDGIFRILNLVPVDFADYDRELSKKDPKSQETRGSSTHPPALVLMTMTLATSWARLFAFI
ncbi:unnamed protein product [Strongylus vulgaris]|uniref:Protein quiver n=1 Tax=Strongylus vulgaris TaxID=40348 RepID=A0A3P7IPT7_STRVU|nr:unnamed protein product [Strongylus vulgaris]